MTTFYICLIKSLYKILILARAYAFAGLFIQK